MRSNRLSKLIALAVTGAVLLVSFGIASCRRAEEQTDSNAVPARRRNVLLVTLDTTRTERLHCYGNPINTSPNLDALAAEGVKFDLAIAPAGITTTSHASILTGLNPQNHGVRVIYAASAYRLVDAIPTLASVLPATSWSKGAVLSSFAVSEFYGFDRGFDYFDNGLSAPTDGVMHELKDGTWAFDVAANQRRSDATTDSAITWLKKTQSPFLLWVHYWDPHDPRVQPPEDVVERFRPPPDTDRNGRARAFYDSEVYYMDSQFGRLLKTMKEMGVYDDTLIVVIADHGEGLGDHQWWSHRLIYQEQIRVPFIVRVPGGPSGKVVPELVRSIDIFPTILDWLDVKPPTAVDGRSLFPLIEGRADEPRMAYADALLQFDLNAKRLLEVRPNHGLLYCMMDKTWKLIYRPLQPANSELFNIERDPGETMNVLAGYPDQAERLLVAMEALGPFVEKPFGEGHDADTLERLRALGYLGDVNE